MNALEVFNGSDGEMTKAYYAELYRHGPIGVVAVNLFRANKCSARAKVYRGGIKGKGSYRKMAYDRKEYSMQQLCEALVANPVDGIAFGWKTDAKTVLQGAHSWVLYVDLPTGQVSFHSPTRHCGPDYKGRWDETRLSTERILQFCGQLLGEPPMPALSVDRNPRDFTRSIASAIDQDDVREERQLRLATEPESLPRNTYQEMLSMRALYEEKSR